MIENCDGKHPEVTRTFELTGKELPSALGKVVKFLISEKMGKRVKILGLMCMEYPGSLFFGMPVVNVFEAGKFLKAVVIVGMIFDEDLCLVDKPGQKCTNLQ